MVDIPIEVISLILALSITLGVIGIWKKIPLTMLIAGAFITFLFIQTDAIILGKIPQSSVTNATNTTYTFIDNTYTLEVWDKIILSLIGAVMFVTGSLIWKQEEKSSF
jgi:hypothetical protein